MTATIPVTTTIDFENDGVSASAKETLEAKYTDAGAWAQYAATVLESKLTAINTATNDFDISEFVDAATVAINAIPDPGALSAIEFTAPSLRGTIATLPTPTEHTAGTVPSTEISFTNEDFTDSTLTAVKSKIEASLSSDSTGLGTAETALFARETARQNAVRSAAYTEITTQFSSRGFDVPPGALLAKQTEANNQSTLQLSNSSSQIMAESARLAQAWNKTTVTSAIQLTDVLARVFDSKVMRAFEAAKNSVLMSLEGFKASIAEVVAAADLEGKYIKAVADGNESLARMLSAESSAQGSYVQAQGQRNSAEAVGSEILARKAIAIAAISKDFSLSNIDSATRKYLGDISVLQGVAQSSAQMVAAALNSVNVSASVGTTASYSSTQTVSASTTDTYGGWNSDTEEFEHRNPTLPVPG